jgi:hypothetical protein
MGVTRNPKRSRKSTAFDGSRRLVLTLKVRGPGVRSGRIPVPELIRICRDAQKAVTRQAEAMQGRRSTVHPGPSTLPIQQECTLELVGLKKGSTTLQFGLAKPQLPLPDQLTLGTDVVFEVGQTIKALNNGNHREDIDVGVLEGLYDLGAIIKSKDVSELEWIVPRLGARKIIKAKFTDKVRERVAQRLSSPRTERLHVDGVLDMADFKPQDQKCRIDPAIGASVICTFDERQANKVQGLLRKPIRVTGIATFVPDSTRIDILRIDSIEPLPSLSLGEGNFYISASLEELASSQKVGPLKRASDLAGAIPEDEDVDRFLGDIYQARE